MGKYVVTLKGKKTVLDSEEEYYMFHWLKELQSRTDLLEKFRRPKNPYELVPKATYKTIKHLKTKSKVVDRHLLSSLTYINDFDLALRRKWFLNFPDIFKILHPVKDVNIVYLDIKGTFSKNNSDIRFPDRQKLMYYLENKYVQKVIPLSSKTSKGLFERTFYPSVYFFTGKGNARKTKMNGKLVPCAGLEKYPMIEDFLKKIK